MKNLRLSASAVAVLLAGCAAAPATPAPRAADAATTPDRIILFIGDGTGLPQWSAAYLWARELAVAELPELALMATQSANSRVTDSAAGATALATGVRTYNGAIGVGPDSARLQTVVELAELRGMSTGLVATSSITHATPASFAAHVKSRSQYEDIAVHLSRSGVDVLLGGGRLFFDKVTRGDGQDLLGRMRQEYTFVHDRAGLEAANRTRTRRLLGLFADDAMPTARARTPSLAEMTEAALNVLDRDDDGFFLMVEASQPDWIAHDNAPLALLATEVVDLDQAVRVALDYQRRQPGTLVVVTADHETGGAALHYHDDVYVPTDTSRFIASYTTPGHTGELVPLFAGGPGAERFGGIMAIDAVGRILKEFVGRMGEEPPARASGD